MSELLTKSAEVFTEPVEVFTEPVEVQRASVLPAEKMKLKQMMHFLPKFDSE